MFDFVPVTLYTDVQYYLILLVLLAVLLHSTSVDFTDRQGIKTLANFGWFFVVVFTLYIGQRPVSYVFGDTVNYAKGYAELQRGAPVVIKSDYLFNYMMVASSKIMSVRSFFQLVDLIYIIPVVIFCRKYFKTYWFYGFLLFVASFSFWTYGTNGLRNGLGTSLFILALCFYERRVVMYSLFVVAYFMHASLIIPTAAFIVSGIYRHPKAYLYVWFAAIPLSLAGGSSWMSFFSSLGIAEDRTTGYLTGQDEFMDQFSQTGFRWDFLMYSASAIYAGWYFIFKKQIKDIFYIHLFGLYCISNAFWILVITAAFSNRFAYLSWFLMPAVITYPMFRYKMWPQQYRIIAVVLLAYFMFTFVMNVVLY